MRKVLCCMFLMLFLCACGTKKETHTDTSGKTFDTEEKKDEIPAMQPTGGGINCYRIVVDEETGKTKEGMFLDRTVKYDGNKIKMGVSFSFFGHSEEEIPALMMLVLDDRLIPFSVDGTEESILYEVVMENEKEYNTYIEFLPLGVSDTEEKSISVVVIPFYNKPEISLGENDILNYTLGIISENGNLEVEEYLPSEDAFLADVTTVYQKELCDISEYNKMVSDYLIFDEEKNFYYCGDYPAGEYVTFLFCDGKLYLGFGGNSYFLWEKGDESYVHHKIDLTSLEKGTHIFFALTLERNTITSRAKKSMNCEVQIDE